MQKKLGKKARISFSTLEMEYNARYGMFPDYHHTELCQKYGADVANRDVQANIDAVWNDMKNRYNPTFHPAENSPFKSDNRTESKGVTA